MENYKLEFLLGVDRPYVNIYIHKECIKMDGIGQFVAQNKEKLYNIYSEQIKSKGVKSARGN